MGQIWGTDALGGFMYSDNLSAKLRMSLRGTFKFRQFADVKDASEQGIGKGETFHWNVYSKAATKGRALLETEVMPETNFTISQGSLTITEYGNSVPYNAKLDNLSEHPVTEIINKVMKVDALEVLDDACAAQFDRTALRYCGTSPTAGALTTNGVPSGTNASGLLKYHIKRIVDAMKTRNIPAFTSDDYMCISMPSTYRPFKDELENTSQYVDTGFKMIRAGEIGRYESTRFCEQTQIPIAGIGTASTAWSGGLSDWACFFGADTVAEAIACPEEVRGKIPTDFGRSKGVAWYYLGGFGLVHTDALNSRVVLWDSAA